ncbi:PAX3- and PAX7-binding protein 1 [Lepisosteus oculatus]|uniref:PAX3- and PAX7-binding protein 1 n=1 Tax=Lepisosteus oculatus TaxID=7918 RepID=UPI0003EAE302|nr:PREDICTED: PAX3- and PAX7-binding protein 1 [Lepisosteus oculatus]
MFKKAKRVNFRRRNESDDEENEESQPQALQQQSCGPADETCLREAGVNNSELGSANVPASEDVVHHGNGLQSNAAKPKEKKKIKDNKEAPKASLLSFHDEEDDTEVFKVKKSNHSKKIVKQLKKEYKEDLERTGTVKQESSAAVDEPMTVAVTMKDDLRLEGSLPCSEQGEEEMEVDSNEESEEDQKTSAGGAFSSALSSLSTLRPGEIPDAAFIHAARKRRQLARELGDAIPMESEVGKNRLVREDEHDASDDEDDDEKRRIVFSVREKTQRQKIAEEIGIEGSDDEALDAGGQDEELSRWEQEQIRKGISIPQVQASQPEDVTMYYQSSYEASSYGSSYGLPYTYSSVGSEDSKQLKSESSVTYSAPSSEMTPITTDLVKKRLKDRLNSMREVHSSNKKRYEKIQQELESSTNMIERLEGSSDGVADQYKFLQEMRGYVRDLLECFSEKVPLILELESAMHQLLRQRAARLVQRRQDDIKDESSEFASHSSKALMAPNLDSFGRDRGAYQEHAKQRRIAEREARRARRRQAREQNGKRAEHCEGLSSDDEETTTDITSFNLEKERILKESKKVFEDVLEDFHSLDCIKARFEVWRRLYFKCYQDAYIGLCLAKLFSPLVRLQLISWSPLEANCPNFEYMLWFEALLFYGCEEQSNLPKGDVDINLLPSIVERVILPKLAVLADQVWDPFSTNQTTRLVVFMHKLIKGYPTVLHGENRNTQELLKTIVMRTRRTLDNDVFMPLYPKNVLENKNSGPYLFFQRQFWSCVKLLGNILQWHGVLSNTSLRELAVDSMLNRYILSALQSTDPGEDSIEKTQSVISCFPKQWFTSLKGQQTLPQLENVCRYLKHVANTVYRLSLGGSDVDKRNARDHIKEVVKLLGSINALDHAMAVSTEHGIKDFKALLDGK